MSWFLFLSIFLLVFSGCSQSSNDPGVARSITVSGFSNFADVPVGTPVKTTVTLVNSSPEARVYALSGSSDFSFNYPFGSCTNPMASGSSCVLEIILLPTSVGEISGTLTFSEETAVFVANGILPPVLSLDSSSVSIGTISAGDSINFTLVVTNDGDLPSGFPSITGDSALGLSSNTCGSYIEKDESCSLNFSYTPTVSTPSLNSLISLATGYGNATFTISGVVLAGPISGDITFATAPATIPGDGGVYSFTTVVLRDRYGNQVEDGIQATVSFAAMNNAGDTNPFTITTSGGRYAFSLYSSFVNEPRAISVNVNDTASGYTAGVIEYE